jgi:hypothetical protein
MHCQPVACSDIAKYQNFVINSLGKLGNEEDFDVQ